MKITYFIGIDVSKATLDVALCYVNNPEVFLHRQFSNSIAGCKQMLSWLKELKINLAEAFFAMEHSGWYTLELCCFLQEQQCLFTLISPLHLKKSLGIVRAVPRRDKNDKVDSQRIASFIFLHRHKLKAMELPSDCLLEPGAGALKHLFAFRSRLVKTQSSLKQTLQELKASAHLVDNRFIMKQSEKQLKLIREQIKQTEEQIMAVSQQDKCIAKNLKLPPGGPVCSIPGIGLVTAVALILCTNNFISFENARKFATYCGVAPFEYRSGDTIRGRTKTSPLANHRIKALLSNCASAAIQHDKEIKDYYLRKIKEGKAKMVVINAVRAKLITRIFAVIQRGTEYVVFKQYGMAA